ncbi:unnamed protein product [Linum tenue]|nr:unnamed protein product [Linum tenue]
MWHSPH